MKNVNLLFDKNPGIIKKVRLEKNGFHFVYSGDVFNGDTILLIIKFVNGIKKQYKSVKIPIYFEFGNVLIKDKLTYVIFECICYFLMEQKYTVYVYWNPKKRIVTDGVFSSPLKLLNNDRKESKSKFLTKFNFDTYENHFRKLIPANSTGNFQGNLMDEINSFLKRYPISDDSKEEIAEVVSELVGNSWEHAQSDCLIDIDITNKHTKIKDNIEQDGKYIGVNIAIINFSNKLFGDDLKIKISQGHLQGKYIDLNNAKKNHQSYFSDFYKEEDFWNISSLQDKISGRINKVNIGGTGSRVLIRSLQKKADENNCYMLSGKRIVYFLSQFLEYNENGWIGFNKSNDFFNDIPDADVVTSCPTLLPGCSYNLNFIMKAEEE